MSYWLPALLHAKNDFFQIPKTKILKVPLPLLQLTRLDYMSLSATTLNIVNKFCMKAFGLDENKEYFIKTGTYSSKYDFRNCHVYSAKEVRELGSYLLFIHFDALQMASPLNFDPITGKSHSIYGVSTCREWVVREYLPGSGPCIYEGLPLRPEFRVFVDLDTDQVIGINPYWDPDIMKKKFSSDEKDPHLLHDYVTYSMYEDTLMEFYNKNKNLIIQELEKILPDIELTGQWSIDIMADGDKFYLIDMALAQNSALLKCVPAGLLKKEPENWIPTFN